MRIRALACRLNDFARSLKLQWGTRWDSASDLGTDVAQILTYTDLIDDSISGLAAIKTEVETKSLASAGGSVATTTRLGLLVRWIADALNTATTGIVDRVLAIKTQTDKLASAALVVGASASTNWNTGTGTSTEAGADLVTIGGAGVKQKLVKLLVNVAAVTTGSVVEVRAYDSANAVAGKRLAYQQVRTTPAQGTPPDIIDIIAQTGGPVELDNAMRIEFYSSTNEAKVINYEYRLELR